MDRASFEISCHGAGKRPNIQIDNCVKYPAGAVCIENPAGFAADGAGERVLTIQAGIVQTRFPRHVTFF